MLSVCPPCALASALQIRAVCELAGIKDLRGKVYGSHNPNSTIRALFEARALSYGSRRSGALAAHALSLFSSKAADQQVGCVSALQALDAVRSPDEVAQARGRTVIRVNPGSDFKRHSPYGVLT